MLDDKKTTALWIAIMILLLWIWRIQSTVPTTKEMNSNVESAVDELNSKIEEVEETADEGKTVAEEAKQEAEEAKQEAEEGAAAIAARR
ncbi:MAG: alanine-zipper protein [Bryobacteraceae bacterium]